MNMAAEVSVHHEVVIGISLSKALRTSLAGFDPNLLTQAERIVEWFGNSGPGPEYGAAWCETVLRLAQSNLGSSVIGAFMQLSERWRVKSHVELLLAIGQMASAVGTHAGGRVVRELLAALTIAWSPPADPQGTGTVLTALRQLSEHAPDVLPLVSARLPTLLSTVPAAGFDAWVSGGLRAYGHNAGKRRAYFALDDPLSLRLLAGQGNDDGLARIEKRLGLGMIALWDVNTPIRPIHAKRDCPVPRRGSFVGDIVRLPDAFQGVTGSESDRLYAAATAHLGAHLRYSRLRFPVGRLKPMQVVLVSLIEDARVEALARAEFPGLARLWKPFHDATLPIGTTAPALMRRLARALFDHEAHDDHGWVEKGRALFLAARDRWHEAASSREIGGLLGNDLGQMRIQFDARAYVVEPAYRDDNMGLWDFGDDAATTDDDLAVAVDALRPEQREQGAGKPEAKAPETETETIARARVVRNEDDDGIAVASYPEWDYALGRERPEWTTILEAPIAIDASSAAHVDDLVVARKVTSVTRRVSVGRRLRQRGLYEGDTLDLDACVAYRIARRAGEQPQARIFQREIAGSHDLDMLLLLDVSESTAGRDSSGRSIIDMARESASILAGAVDAAGDDLAIHAFRSNSREKVRYYRVKDFDEPFDRVSQTRLDALRSGESTRLGAAVRHAGVQLTSRRAHRRVLVILTDGEPSDIDSIDAKYLIEDARHACQNLRKSGVDVFAFGMGQGPFEHLGFIVGQRRVMQVSTIANLPGHVVQLYAELKK